MLSPGEIPRRSMRPTTHPGAAGSCRVTAQERAANRSPRTFARLGRASRTIRARTNSCAGGLYSQTTCRRSPPRLRRVPRTSSSTRSRATRFRSRRKKKNRHLDYWNNHPKGGFAPGSRHLFDLVPTSTRPRRRWPWSMSPFVAAHRTVYRGAVHARHIGCWCGSRFVGDIHRTQQVLFSGGGGWTR